MMADTPRSSTDSSSQDHICIYQEDFERPQKEMDFPSARLNSKMPRNVLRINTYSKSDLPERYMSSEEEPSPSPDSSDAESTCSEELKHKASARVLANEAPIDFAALEADFTIEIAVAMPIVAHGRPKLIDISSLAPMQKRKRVIKQPVAPSSKHTLVRKISNISSLAAGNNPFAANEAAEVIVPADRALIIAQKQAAMAASRRLKEQQQQQQQQQQIPRPRLSSAPISWFPEEEEYHTADEERDESFAAGPNNYEYDTWDAFPTITEESTPRSSPSRLSIQSTTTTTRKRNNSNPFSPAALGKGMARTWSIASKKVHHGSCSSSSSSQITAIYSPQHQQQQLREKPSFSSFQQQPERKIERQLSKKSKMVARGANEREDNLVLPGYPFEEPLVA
ncbi:MAG: hypothetical protein L6R37_002143 [Teloschistes peruensis]|nr:MAG: hypothetical protein L6R37_002143 [Teloschistes peruensis]